MIKKLVIKPGVILQQLILFGILISPLLNISETLGILAGVFSDIFSVPPYLKAVKDVLFVLLLLVGLVTALERRAVITQKRYIIALVFILFSLAVSLIYGEKIHLILAGLRWLMPFLLLAFIYDIVDQTFQERCAKTVLIVFSFGFILQILQLFLVKQFYGVNFLGLSARCPGFYFYPSPMALFSVLTLFYLQYFSTFSTRGKIFWQVLAVASVIMTGSGTGFLVLALYFGAMAFMRIKQKALVLILIALLFIPLAVYLPVISQRSDVYKSYADRQSTLEDVAGNTGLLSSHFGGGTNTAVMLSKFLQNETGEALVTDSTLTSMLYNAGYLALLFFILYFLGVLEWRLINLQFLIIFGLFMLTNVIFEVFPSSLLFAVNLMYLYKQKNKGHIRVKF
jgi:hypothetical protein